MLSRRSFLKSAAAVTAAPFAFTRPAAAVAANDKIALGFIGVGVMSRGHLENFLGRPEVEVVAVCDVVTERREDAVQRVGKRYADRIESGAYKGVKAFTDFRELLAVFDIARWALGVDRTGPVEVVPPADPKTGRGLRFVYANGAVMIHDEFEKGKDGKEVRADCVFEGGEGTILVSRGGISSLPESVLKEPIGEAEKQSTRAATARRTGSTASGPGRRRSARRRWATGRRASATWGTSATGWGGR